MRRRLKALAEDVGWALGTLADGSAVIGKRWTPEGTIAEVRYVPEAPDPEREKPTFETMTVYVSAALSGDVLSRVLAHELTHCAMLSYGLAADIHRVVPTHMWREAEEWAANLVADYAPVILAETDEIARGW